MKRKIVSWIMIMAILLNYSHINIFSTVFAEEKSISKNSKTEEKVTKDNNKILDLELSDSYLELGIGKEHKLEYNLITEDNYKEDIVWSCDDENIATVNDGIIKAINPGKATIAVKTIDEEFIKFCEVSVVGESSNTFSTGDYYEFTLEKNKNYEIINKSDKQINITVGYSNKYDSITYDNNGNIYSYYKNNYGNMYIAAQYKIKVGIKENDIKINIPNSDKDFIEIKEVESPLLYEGVLNNETTYELTSSGDRSLSLKQIDLGTIYYDSINYNSGGGISSFYKNDHGTISTNNNKKKIRIKDKDYNYYIPYERKDDLQIVESQEELIYEGVLNNETTYELTSSGDKSVSLKPIDSGIIRYDYIIYNSDGSIGSFYKNNTSSSIYTDANKRKVRIKDKDCNYYIPYERKEELKIVESQEELIYDGVLKSNTTYEITSSGYRSLYLKPIDYSVIIRYDYINYNSDGSIGSFYKNHTSSSIYTDANKRKVRIKDKDCNYYIPYEQKDKLDIKEINEPILHKFEMEENKSYKIYNKSDKNVVLKNNNYNFKYDYVLYKADSNYKYMTNQYGDITLKTNEHIVIAKNQNNNANALWYIPYEYYNNEIVIKESESSIDELFDLQPKIKVDIRKVLSKNETDEENNIIEDTLDNYYISVKNKTQNKNINGIQLKGKYIVLQNDNINPNDELSIKLESKNNDSLITTVDIKLDENRQANIVTNIIQLGYIKIKHNNTDNTTIRTLLFNKEGNNIGTISTSNNKEIKTGYLKAGEYTIVILKSDGNLWRIDKLSDFKQRGLVENTDYIKYSLEINDGIISEIKINKIPLLDENRISFFNRYNTRISTSSESVTTNGLIEVNLKYDFKDIYSNNNIKNIKMNFNIPNTVSLVENSVLIDNEKANYTINGKIIVPVNKLSGTIKFFIRPHEANKLNIKVESSFYYNNKNIYETIGQTEVDVNYITLNGPKESSNKSINLYGVSAPNTAVSIYENNKKIGETTSNKSGKWSKTVTLNNAYNGSIHKFIAKINDGKDNEKISNLITTVYKLKAPVIKKVEMIYNNKKYDLTESIINGKNHVITIGPGNCLFTFNLDIEKSDNIKSLYVTSTRNDVKKKLEAKYDSNTKKWIASGYFDPKDKGYIPRALNIEYKTNDSIFSIGNIDFESKEFLESLPQNWKDSNINVIKDDKKGNTNVEVTMPDETKLDIITNSSNIPKNFTTSDAISQGYVSYGNNIYIKTYKTDEKLEASIIDFRNGTINNIIGEISSSYGNFVGIWDFIKEMGTVSEAWDRYDYLMNNHPEYKDAINGLRYISGLKLLLASTGALAAIGVGSISFPAAMLATAASAIASYLTGVVEDIINGEALPLWVKFLIDPSGYVYEGVDSNRIEGVTTTVYYKDENGQAVKWNAEEYDQVNPLITDKEGKYAWDVPEGLWQVKYEKEGYETTYSEWLPVPPPQTEVNIGIVSLEKPKIELFNIYEDRAEVTFNKYIDVSTINTDSIKLNDKLGNEISIEIEPVEQKEAKDKKVLAKKFILKANAKNTLSFNNEYTLTVKNTVKTYAGINNDLDIIAKTTYKPLPTVIKVDDSYEVKYGKEINIPVSIDNISNSDEFEVTATSSMDDIVSVSTNKVKFDKDGKAIIKAVGNLPGEAEITFNIEGTDLESKTKVNVVLPNENNIQNTAPNIDAKDIELRVGDDFRELEGVTAYDKEDGDITSRIVVIENNVNTSTEGIYKVVYEVRDDNGSTTTKEIKVTVKPKLTLINRPPKIEVEDIKIAVGSIFEAMSIVKATDYEDGDITNKIEIVENTVNTSKAGVYKVVYKVIDSKGAIATKTITVTVEKKEVIPPIQKPIVFNDIKGHWAEETIKEFIDKKFINGYEDNTFKPNNNMTRAEFVKVVNKVFGYSQKGKEDFTDVNEKDWFYNDICIGIKEGYIKGKSKDIFAPNDNITREEVAMILTNIMKNKDENLDKLNTFKDGDKTSQWAQSSVEGAIEAGYLNGDNQGLLNPTNNITRAEAISMLSRVKK